MASAAASPCAVVGATAASSTGSALATVSRRASFAASLKATITAINPNSDEPTACPMSTPAAP